MPDLLPITTQLASRWAQSLWTSWAIGLFALCWLAAGTVSAQAPPPAHVASAAWQRLSPSQKAALQPLASQWHSLPADQQQKWLAVAEQYPRLTPTEQTRLQQRMTQWAAMSSSERQQARRNFDAVREDTSTQERKAKWEAYQSLDETARKALAPTAPAPRAVHPPRVSDGPAVIKP